MKKVILVCFCLLLLVGCKDKQITDKPKDNDNENFVLEKVDENKDYVYLEKYREVTFNDGETYKLDNIIVNINSDDVSNVNLELNSFVKRSYKDFQLIEGKLQQGNVISYDYYVSDDYISIIQRYYKYIDGIHGEEQSNVYVISLKTGKTVSSSALLDNYNLDNDKLYDKVEEKLDSEDMAFSLMNLKEDGYSLYVNNENKLCIIFYEIDNVDSKKNELVLD